MTFLAPAELPRSITNTAHLRGRAPVQQPNRQALHRHDGVKDIFGHKSSLSAAGPEAALPEWINVLKLRSVPEGSSGVANNAVIRVLEDRRIFIFVMAKMVCDALAPTMCWICPESPPPGTVQVSASGWRYRHSVVLHPFFVFCHRTRTGQLRTFALQSCSASAMFSLLPMPRPR